ncbi:LacI family DNA-binding transcriptional regulator [Fredinandcohnia sp. 179-A 10B2 NHS]|uniref:LacI family DNA-binding transcriptional regulator n=1 Tax=Fredinandcohnia sp. 179-A 10B2 NHS TaxID=3235176 RepID=UPI00399F67BB
MKDLAKHLGVSVSTVSRALNNHSDIHIETKKQVLEAAQQFNYRPNSIARSLIQRKTFTVGLMVPDIADPFFSNIAVGVEEIFTNSGYQVVYGNTMRNKEKELQFIESVFERKMDGVIVTPDHVDEELISLLNRLEVPIVFLRRRTPAEVNAPFVDVDHYTGACEAVSYLIENGHRDIGFLAMTQDSFVSKERLRGYMDTMQKHGLTPTDNSIEVAGRTIESGRNAMEKLHEKNPQLTAVFASNDLLGIGALEWLAIKDIKVPEQISIIGFDDLVFSSLYWIQLTTMAQPRKKMGRFAADLLLSMINGSEENDSVLLKAKLVERKTCRVVTTV